jgi:putative spermidine/putrescine transport system permease protein
MAVVAQTRSGRRSVLSGVFAVVAALDLVFLIVPILFIIPLSLTSAGYLVFPPPGFSLRWYRELLGRPEWMASLLFSAEMSAAATLLTVVLGLSASIAFVRARFPGKTAVYTIVLAPLIVPSVITAIAVYLFLARLNLAGGIAGMALGLTVVTLPLFIIVVSATLQGFDQRLEQAAIGLGADPVVAFLRVTLPLIAPGVISGALFAFLTAFDDLLIPLLLSGTAPLPLSVRIWTNLITQVDPTIAAVSSFLTVVAVLVLSASALLRRPPR